MFRMACKRCRYCLCCTEGEANLEMAIDRPDGVEAAVDLLETRRLHHHQHHENLKTELQKKIHPSPELKKKALNFVHCTTFHGLDQLVSSTNLGGKLFWLLVIVFVLVVVVLQMKSLLAYFMENPTLTSISVVYPDEGLQFPSITICTLSKTNKTRLRERYPKITDMLAEFSTASFLSAYSTALMDVGYFYRRNKSEEKLQEELESELGDERMIDFIEGTTFDCQGQFRLCWFENLDIYECCDPSNANEITVERFLIHSGPCFEFKFTKSRQRLPGPVGGFGFVYWYPNNDILPSVFNSYDEHAIQLYTSPSEAMLEKNPIVLQVGTHSHISLHATKTTRLMADQLGRSTCVEKYLKYFANYSYPACQVECLIDMMLLKCNCTGLNTYADSADHLCNPVRAFDCYKKLAYNFTDMLVRCRREKCTEACTYWSYKSSLTVGKVFNPSLEKEMVKYWRLPNNSDVSHSLIIADVYFSEIEYTDVKQMPALTVETFVSAIGGAMGLWTGASIITWIHLVYFCLAAWCVNREKAKQNMRQSASMVVRDETAVQNAK